MRSRYVVWGLALAVVFLIGPNTVAESGTIYWSSLTPPDFNEFFRADLNGGGVQTLPGEGLYFTLDLPNGKRYWHDIGVGALKRSNLNGSSVEELYAESTVASDLDLDIASGKVYVGLIANEGCGFIFRRNLDGSNSEVLVSDERARGVSLDLAAGKLYWADQCGAAVKRSNLDGSGVEVLVALEGFPSDLTLDLDADKIYWARSAGGDGAVIERSSLDGTGVETLVSAQSIDGIALDLGASKLYWSEPLFSKEIRRSDLNGDNIEVVISDVSAVRLEIDSLGGGSNVPAVGGPGMAVLFLLTLLGSSVARLGKKP